MSFSPVTESAGTNLVRLKRQLTEPALAAATGADWAAAPGAAPPRAPGRGRAPRRGANPAHPRARPRQPRREPAGQGPLGAGRAGGGPRALSGRARARPDQPGPR